MQDVEDQSFIPGSVGSFRADLTQVHILLQTLHNSRQQMQFSVRSSFQAEVVKGWQGSCLLTRNLGKASHK